MVAHTAETSVRQAGVGDKDELALGMQAVGPADPGKCLIYH